MFTPYHPTQPLPVPIPYVLFVRDCVCVCVSVCYGFSACICPFCFFDLARPQFEIQFHTPTHTHTYAHLRAVCGYNFSIIVEFLLIFFSVVLFLVFPQLPLIFCGICGCLPRQRLECNLCSLAKCWAFAAASSPPASPPSWPTVCFASCFSDSVLCSSAFIATCHLRDLRLSQQPNQTKPEQDEPSHVKPSV